MFILVPEGTFDNSRFGGGYIFFRDVAFNVAS
jgi:hypothetical protein